MAVGLSLVPLIVVFQVANGMIEGITLRFLEVGTYHMQAIARGDPPAENVSLAVDRLRELEEVTLAGAERRGVGLLYSDAGRSGTVVRAMAEELVQDSGFQEFMITDAGSFDISTEEDIVLGREIARRLEVGPGDEVRLLTVLQRNDRPPIPRVQRFTVAGVVSTGYQDLDRLWSFVDLGLGRRILPDTSAYDLVGIKIRDPFALQNPFRAASDDGLLLPSRMREMLGLDWRVLTWFELERSQYVSFITTKNMLVVIMALVVAVAAITISSALVMLVLEKQEEIAILKAIGASPNALRSYFVTAGFFLGAMGVAVGILVGLAAAVNINELLRLVEWAGNAVLDLFLGVPEGGPRIDIFNQDFYLQDIPIRLRFDEVFVAAAAGVALATLSSFVPAARAAAVRPLETMTKH